MASWCQGQGLDVYDRRRPDSLQLDRRHACWFIDTDYNGESFFVRHAYFTGAAIRTSGSSARSRRSGRGRLVALYSTQSYPFDPPRRQDRRQGHQSLWDEVLKVYQCKWNPRRNSTASASQARRLRPEERTARSLAWRRVIASNTQAFLYPPSSTASTS